MQHYKAYTELLCLTVRDTMQLHQNENRCAARTTKENSSKDNNDEISWAKLSQEGSIDGTWSTWIRTQKKSHNNQKSRKYQKIILINHQTAHTWCLYFSEFAAC